MCQFKIYFKLAMLMMLVDVNRYHSIDRLPPIATFKDQSK